MSVRNVSLHIYTDMAQLDGQDIPERILGVFLTTLIAARHDRGSNGEERAAGQGEGQLPARGPNSSRGFIYQVTPKLQTSAEVAEQVRFFAAVEAELGLPDNSILIGIMNEELGMTLQLAESLRAAQSRTFFINTGFLDRTGSQIRAQLHAGPVDLARRPDPGNLQHQLRTAQRGRGHPGRRPPQRQDWQGDAGTQPGYGRDAGAQN